ncbi:hypothetical protein [Paenibacillus daejeonensis]|uniref:hypothetical protein n=1 Tax=Paenibacillus daejeonensis TaxID=135193 RepID=UPI000371950E|nr:hypothetical protein [Paenibacillus daejeonensis]
MQKLIKPLLIAFISLVILASIFAYNNWEMWQYKYGYRPVVLNLVEPDESDEQGETIVLKNPSKWISEMKVGITDYYWVEGINSLRFGLWYRDWDYRDYETYEEIFDVRIRDNQGQVYKPYVALMPNLGMYESFQIRDFRGIDLNNVEQLFLDINLAQDTGKLHSVEIFSKSGRNIGD